MTTTIEGQLEIDHERGVIYFHENKTGTSLLRICSLPSPIPKDRPLDISATGVICNWSGKTRTFAGIQKMLLKRKPVVIKRAEQER